MPFFRLAFFGFFRTTPFGLLSPLRSAYGALISIHASADSFLPSCPCPVLALWVRVLGRHIRSGLYTFLLGIFCSSFCTLSPTQRAIMPTLLLTAAFAPTSIYSCLSLYLECLELILSLALLPVYLQIFRFQPTCHSLRPYRLSGSAAGSSACASPSCFFFVPWSFRKISLLLFLFPRHVKAHTLTFRSLRSVSPMGLRRLFAVLCTVLSWLMFLPSRSQTSLPFLTFHC